ncbi:MAG TPA: hypothetical protein VGZ02_02345 [Candidatus Baltobacteraceae bacterium]|jgi:hypothetical protein|nr:hypothetical protein [Candidatus Baltobacteraceae bacterium]
MNDCLEALERRIEAIEVPRFDFTTITARRSGQPARQARWRSALTIALLIVVPALAAAAVHFIPLQVDHRFGNWQLFGPSREFTHPTAADFSTLARQAPYRVVWPAGVPREEKLMLLSSTGNEVFIAAYRCPSIDLRKGNDALSTFIIIPKSYAAVNPKLASWFESQMHNAALNTLWNAGDESVLLSTGCLTPAQVDNIRALMITAGKRRP